MEDVILASFTWSEEDYVAFTRAVGMLRNRAHDTWVMRAFLLLHGHLFLVGGLFVAGCSLSWNRGENAPIPPVVVMVSLAFSVFAAYVLFTRWYGLRWLTNRAFRSSRVADLKLSYQFRPTQIETTTRLIQSKMDWSLITRLVEFRDGFLLLSDKIGYWLPKHAFTEPFDDVRFLELAKCVVEKYQFIDRLTYADHGRGKAEESIDRPHSPSKHDSPGGVAVQDAPSQV